MKTFCNTLFLFALSTCITEELQSQWSQIAGVDSVTSVVIVGDTLFAGTLKGVFRSTDGTTLIAVNDGLTSIRVSSILVNSTGTVFAATDSSVFRSTDHGTTWSASNSGLTDSIVTSLLHYGNVLFAGTLHNGMFTSADDGITWIHRSSGLTDSTIRALALCDTVLFAATPSSMFRSTDYGMSWNVIHLGAGQYSTTSLCAARGTVYAGTQEFGVMRSLNHGGSWLQVNTGLLGIVVRSLAIDASGNVFAGTAADIFASTIGGDDMKSLKLASGRVNAIAFDSTSRVFVGATGGIFRSDSSTANPSDPVLMSPQNGIGGLSTNLLFVWHPLERATGYLVHVAKDSSFTSIILNTLIAGTSAPVQGLSNFQKYYWRIRGRNWIGGTSQWSSVWNFSTIVAPPDLVDPPDSAIDVQPNLIVSWGVSEGAVTYTLELSTDPTFAWIVYSNANLHTAYDSLKDLSRFTRYYWRVSAIDTSRAGSHSRVWSFTTAGLPPVIYSFSPASASPGDTLIISGDNFNLTPFNNLVWFGGMKGFVVKATLDTLKAVIPPGATCSAISVTINRLTGYSGTPFVPTFHGTGGIASTSFKQKVDFSTGSNPQCIAVSDVDGDRKLDIITANTGANSFSILRNSTFGPDISTASFVEQVGFATGSNPISLAIGDIDGDGKPDLASVSANSLVNTVSVLRNTSATGIITSSSFAAKVDFAVGKYPYAVAIADLDNDGKPELIVANHDSNTISVLHNTNRSSGISSSTFGSKVDFPTGGYPSAVVVGDMNGDGKTDIAVANTISNNVSVFCNRALTGRIDFSSLAPKVDFAVGYAPTTIVIADIDGDGKPDLAAGNQGGNSVSVLRNTGTLGIISGASFVPSVSFSVGMSPYGLAVGDVDGDCKPDLATANYGSNSVSVLRNTSHPGAINTSSFSAAVDFATANRPISVTIADVDNDRRPDLEVACFYADLVSVIQNASTVVGVHQEKSELFRFRLSQNYPNPFNPTTTIAFSLGLPGFVSLKVYDVLGRQVATLVSQKMEAGEHSVEWIAQTQTSGVYFYRLQAGSFLETRRLILLR